MSTKKTGWEELDKWVGGGSPPAGVPAVDAPEPNTKTTGWAALDKWVGEGGAPAEPATGGSAAPSGGGASSGGGFMGWLKRLFGGN